MRKIEQAMVQAIRQRRSWKSDNTRVSISDGRVEVALHGHTIAVLHDGQVCLDDCGWQTVTTKSRLNAIIKGVVTSASGISQIKGTWHLRHNGQTVAWDGGAVIAC